MDWNNELFKSAKNGDLEKIKECLANGANVNAVKTQYNYTALMVASSGGHLDIVKYLIENGANINAKDNNGETALMCGAFGNFEITKCLIENGADINAKDNNGETALICASKLEVAQYLIENGADINARTNNGANVLMCASWRGYLEVVKHIIANGADVNARDNEGETALMYASERGYLEVVKCLIENGADVNVRNNKGNTTLDLAKTNNKWATSFIDEIEFLINTANADWKKQLFISISKGDLDKVKQCLANGANVNAKGGYYNLGGYRSGTALMCASMEGHSNIVKCLIENGADVNAKNDNGWTALDCARRALASYKQNDKFDEIEFLINSANADWTKQLFSSVSKCNLVEIKQCLANGADVNAKDNNGRTALMCATKLEVAQYLVESGADINAKDDDGCIALMCATKRGYLEGVKYLIESGADVNAKDNNGRTALMEASKYDGDEQLEVVEYLIENGADINTKDNDGKTALDFAKYEILDFLRNGANVYWNTQLLRHAEWANLNKVKQCFKKGANVNAKDDDDWTALIISLVGYDYENFKSHINYNLREVLLVNSYYATVLEWISGDCEVVKYLIENGADVNAKTNGDWTALMFASAGGYIEVIKLLIKKGANVNAKDCYSRTALMFASRCGHLEVVKCLIEKGADINAKDNDGRTAFDSAETDEIALFLIDVANRNR